MKFFTMFIDVLKGGVNFGKEEKSDGYILKFESHFQQMQNIMFN